MFDHPVILLIAFFSLVSPLAFICITAFASRKISLRSYLAGLEDGTAFRLTSLRVGDCITTYKVVVYRGDSVPVEERIVERDITTDPPAPDLDVPLVIVRKTHGNPDNYSITRRQSVPTNVSPA